jgi:Lrp/AsnC family leucine-responsive transcriptional regulator
LCSTAVFHFCLRFFFSSLGYIYYRKFYSSIPYFSKDFAVDDLDYKALALLMERGRAPWTELAEALALSAPAAAERVRKLEEQSVIVGFRAIPNAEALGYPLLAFVHVSLGTRGRREAFLRGVAKHPQVVECHHIAGDDDYLLKVRCRGTSDLEQFLNVALKDRLGIERARTTIALTTVKETTALPTDAPAS